MTTILKEMGIQQWRLRQAHISTVPMLDIDHTVNSEYSGRSIAARSEASSATASEVSSDAVVNSNFEAGVIAANRTSDASLAEAIRKSEPKPSIKQMPSPAAGSVNVIIPAPVPVPAPVATPDPAKSSIVLPPDSVMPLDAEPSRLAEPPISNPIPALDWRGLQRLIDDQSQCQSCGSANSILGSGDPKADWLFVTDAPTSIDLESQQMFSGRAGQLYEAMLLAVGLTRDSVYTTSVFKCVTSDDISVIPSCEKLLQQQIELIQPKVVIAFGEFVAQSMVKSNERLESLRSQELRCYQTKVPVVVSYSPWQLLDQPSLKAGAWQDLKKCLAITQ